MLWKTFRTIKNYINCDFCQMLLLLLLLLLLLTFSLRHRQTLVVAWAIEKKQIAVFWAEKYDVSICFSSPQINIQVSFSGHLLYVVSPSVCPCLLFLFSFFSPEPISTKLYIRSHIIFGWRSFKFVQIKSMLFSNGTW